MKSRKSVKALRSSFERETNPDDRFGFFSNLLATV